MPEKSPLNVKNPFGDLIGLSFSKYEEGYSQCVLEVHEKLLNPLKIVHGGVVYSMADTGMGGALYPCLGEHEQCVTIEIKIVYFMPVFSGVIICDTKVLHRTKKIAVLESEISNTGHLIAKAIGTFSILNGRRD